MGLTTYEWENEVSDEELHAVFPVDFIEDTAASVLATVMASGRSFEIENEKHLLRQFFKAMIYAARMGDEDARWRIGKVKQIRLFYEFGLTE